jgi:O-antigen/teichoic acid export membrane protein
MKYLSSIVYRLNTNHTDARSLTVYRNVIGSIVLKGAGVLVSFLTVSLTLKYISVKDFGIWMTITFLTNWFSLVDVSFGNGLRNSLVLFFGKNDFATARRYVSTLYFLSALCALALCVVFGLAHLALDWTVLLNIQSEKPELINLLITYTLVSFSLQLFLKPINSILLADQRAASVSWILLVVNALSLVLIYGASVGFTPSLLVMAHVFNLVPVIVFGGVSIYLFATSYHAIRPDWRWIDMKLVGELLNVSGQFFFLQLISVVVFTSGGLFISYFLGSDEVGPYSIANKYFSLLTFLYGIFITPYWSAFTDAHVKADTHWIRQTMHRLDRMGALTVLVAILMLALAQPVFDIWIGQKISIPFSLSAWLAVYGVSYVFLSNYNSFASGIGEISQLVKASVVGLLLYIPLLYLLFVTLQLGPSSVVIAGTLWNVFLLLVCQRIYRRYVTK